MADVAAFGTDDPFEAHRVAGDFLLRDPLRNSVLLTILQQRMQKPVPGRYWWVLGAAGDVSAYAMQSPRHFPASVSATESSALDALVLQVAADAPDLPGVIAEAGTASAFAGRWAERLSVPARPVEAEQVYRLDAVVAPLGVPGHVRRAEAPDREALMPWAADFAAIVDLPIDPAETLDRHLSGGQLWLWEDDELVSMANVTLPVGGVSRIGFVYTPPEHRRRGYASACVAAVSGLALESGAESCMLHAQLQNPTSNSVYRRLGFYPVSEVLIYRFGTV